MNALTLHRAGHRLHSLGIPILPALLSRLTLLTFNCFLAPGTEIGEGTQLAYGGIGVFIHPDCRIGRNVTIAPQVTIGGRSRRHGVPVIEDGCFLGVGARILGPVRVGAGSVVGANAVVLEDVPPASVAAGVPARIIRSDIDVLNYA